MSEQRITRVRKQRDTIKEEHLVESTNSLSSHTFFARFCAEQQTDVLTRRCTEHNLKAYYQGAAGLSDILVKACLDLIEDTSAGDYRKSEIKWSPAKKKTEMTLPDMKYIVLIGNGTSHPEQQVAGFTSFMITYEDGIEVLYIYEVHLAPTWQSIGLGKLLMDTVEQIGCSVGIKKVMLTVFKANSRAVNWYDHLGYLEDEFSPAPRRLRNGTIKEASYLILSKVVESP